MLILTFLPQVKGGKKKKKWERVVGSNLLVKHQSRQFDKRKPAKLFLQDVMLSQPQR